MRVRRRRGIHVLMGTLALVAGCSTGRSSMAQRAEVRGVVRDRATGRVIAGARVIGADGSLAETDADGRFHLYVRGALADVRVSAAGHSSEHLEIAGLDAHVELAPIDELWGRGEDGAHVVSFVEETWVLDAGAPGDATILASSTPPAEIDVGACAETSLAQAHSAMTTCATCHDAESASTSCASCHRDEAASIAGAASPAPILGGILASPTPPAVIAAHDGLGGGCLACHGERAARGDARASCTRCHGTTTSMRLAELDRFFALATSSAVDRDTHGTAFEMRSTSSTPLEVIATWARALARDRSHGAHDPRGTLALGHALER